MNAEKALAWLLSGLLLWWLPVALATPAGSSPARTPPSNHRSDILDSLDCGDCHSPAGWRALLDTPAGGGFDHDVTGFPLRGRHRSSTCTACHRSDQQVSQACVSCHADPHQGRLSQRCNECHGANAWQQTSGFDIHRRTRLPLTGMHAMLDCSECHTRSSDRTWSSVPANCFACHAKDYRSSDVHPVHVGSADGQTAPFARDCAQCHRASGWSPAILPLAGLQTQLSAQSLSAHSRHFPIGRGSHRQATCEDCHAQGNAGGAVQCVGCHAHNPQQLHLQHDGPVVTAGRACLGCHPGGAAR